MKISSKTILNIYIFWRDSQDIVYFYFPCSVFKIRKQSVVTIVISPGNTVVQHIVRAIFTIRSTPTKYRSHASFTILRATMLIYWFVPWKNVMEKCPLYQTTTKNSSLSLSVTLFLKILTRSRNHHSTPLLKILNLSNWKAHDDGSKIPLNDHSMILKVYPVITRTTKAIWMTSYSSTIVKKIPPDVDTLFSMMMTSPLHLYNNNNQAASYQETNSDDECLI